MERRLAAILAADVVGYTKQLLVASLGYERAAIDQFEDFGAPAR